MLPPIPHTSPIMPMRNPAKWGIPLVLLILAPMTSCRVAQPPQCETAGLRIDVTSCRQKRGRIDCRLVIWNDHDEKVAFDHETVRLMWGDDRECALKPARRPAPVKIGARGRSEQRWLFEPGQGLPKGSYSIEIRDFRIDELPSGQTDIGA